MAISARRRITRTVARLVDGRQQQDQRGHGGDAQHQLGVAVPAAAAIAGQVAVEIPAAQRGQADVGHFASAQTLRHVRRQGGPQGGMVGRLLHHALQRLRRSARRQAYVQPGDDAAPVRGQVFVQAPLHARRKNLAGSAHQRRVGQGGGGRRIGHNGSHLVLQLLKGERFSQHAARRAQKLERLALGEGDAVGPL
jgi:hypothetical protein